MRHTWTGTLVAVLVFAVVSHGQQKDTQHPAAWIGPMPPAPDAMLGKPSGLSKADSFL